jgi:anti-sigma B factor antagonist
MDVFPSGHDQGRSIITVTGDIDLGTAGNLLAHLAALVRHARRDIGLDLSGVTFIDCAGLRALIAVDALIRANGATMLLTAMSPAVVRLLELVDAPRNTTVPGVAPTATGGPASVATHRTTTPEQTAAPWHDRVAA